MCWLYWVLDCLDKNANNCTSFALMQQKNRIKATVVAFHSSTHLNLNAQQRCIVEEVELCEGSDK